LFYVPNFVDTFAVRKTPKDQELSAMLNINGKFVFGYAGNIGGAQGMTIVAKAAILLKERKDIAFLIIGNGIETSLLEKTYPRKQSCKYNLYPAYCEGNDKPLSISF